MKESASGVPTPIVGERQTLVVRWGLLPVGEISLWTEWTRGDDDESLIALRVRVRSNRALSPVFSLDGFYESLITPSGFQPHRATWNCTERQRVVGEWVKFDRSAGLLRRAVSDRPPMPDVELDDRTRDVGAAILWFRSELAKGNRPGGLRIATGRDLVEIVLRYRGEEPLAETGKGERSLCVEPEVWRNGRRSERNRYLLWFTTAPPNALVRVQVDSPYATLVATRVSRYATAVKTR